MFKKLLIIGASLACLSFNTHACEAHNNALVLNKTSVYSWHLGKNAQNQTYLLVVLNPKALHQLRRKKGMHLSLGDEDFAKYSAVKGGFLVLNPLSSDWNEKKLAQLLN